MIQAVIFDLDGVILNSEPLHFESDRLAIRDYGMELSDEVLERYVGVSGRDMWADLILSLSIPDTLDGVLARQQAHKLKLLAEVKLTPIAGIPKLLEGLRRAGVPLGLASSSPMYFIQAVLENLGFTGYFRIVASGEEVARSKPSPDVFLLAAERLGVMPEVCLVIEDSAHGVRAAKAAGMGCIGYVNPTSGQQNLREADLVVHSFGPDILRHIIKQAR